MFLFENHMIFPKNEKKIKGGKKWPELGFELTMRANENLGEQL